MNYDNNSNINYLLHAELTELWLCNNMIKFLPSEIGNLKCLTVLSVKGNILESVPEEICLLERLRRLYLNNNKIKKLPSLLSSLTKLIDLDIKNNKFEYFPEVICSLRDLIHLNISENNFISLPKKLSKLRFLLSLNMTDTLISGDCSVLASLHWVDVIGYDEIPTSISISIPIPMHIVSSTSTLLSQSQSPSESQLSPLYPITSPNDDSVTIRQHPNISSNTTSCPHGYDEKMSIFPKGLLTDIDEDLDDFLRNKANCRILGKLRRRKGKRSSSNSPSKQNIANRFTLNPYIG